MKIEKELNLNELLHFALTLEQKGEKFYKDCANTISKQDLKDLFLKLSKMEKEHYGFFLKLLEKDKSYDPENPMPNEYQEYLYEYANISLFKIKEKKLEKGNVTDILNFAIDVELYSILYYFELLKYLNETDYDVLQNIITEEKSHYNQLVNILKNYE